MFRQTFKQTEVVQQSAWKDDSQTVRLGVGADTQIGESSASAASACIIARPLHVAPCHSFNHVMGLSWGKADTPLHSCSYWGSWDGLVCKLTNPLFGFLFWNHCSLLF